MSHMRNLYLELRYRIDCYLADRAARRSKASGGTA